MSLLLESLFFLRHSLDVPRLSVNMWEMLINISTEITQESTFVCDER